MTRQQAEETAERVTECTLEDFIRSILRPIIREIVREERNSLDEAAESGIVKPKDMRYYTRDEVCEKLKICKATFHNWKNAGKLPTVKIGGRVYIDAEALDRSLCETDNGHCKRSIS